MHLLAQTDTFSDIFWMSIGFVFLAAIVGAIFAQRKRDRCLKLINDHHITLTTTTGRSIWGDVEVFSKGIEVIYDAPYRTAEGLIKSSYLLYDDEMANVLALSRYVGALTAGEKRQRMRQVSARFRPSIFRRFGRWCRNMLNTVSDAFNKALSAIIGQIAKAKPGSALSQSTGEVNQIGKTIITGVGYGYEPMLERHIGSPVVLELTSPADPDKRSIELPGYLAEYSDRYLAIFNVEQAVGDEFAVRVEDPAEHPGLTIEADSLAVRVTNTAPEPLIIESVRAEGEAAPRELSIVLMQGAGSRLTRLAGDMTLMLRRARFIDIVCPRQYARVRHASGDDVQPADESNAPSLPPAHEDQKVEFP